MEFKVTIWLIGSGKVDPWYLWVYGSKETAIEEKLNARVQSSVIHCRCLIHFFPQLHPTSIKDMLLFLKSQILTLSLD
jgi:hypothetical protein